MVLNFIETSHFVSEKRKFEFKREDGFVNDCYR